MAPAQTTPRVPVLILGKHITALGVLRRFAARGIETYVVDATSEIIVRSRWYRPTEPRLVETSDSDQLTEFLDSLDLTRAVLIPCSDNWTLAVAGLAAKTRQRYMASVAPQDAVAQFLDKNRFGTLVARLGIPHPRSLSLDRPADLALVTDADLANGFLKPTDSSRHNVIFGTKGSFARSRDAAARVIERGSAAGIAFILQEWIPGNMSMTILIDGFVDRNGAITAMVARRRIRMDPPRLAATASDVTIPLSDVSDVLPGLRSLLADVAYRGIFSVEYKFDVRDGKFKIIEVNPRAFWHNAHIARAGVDLPWMAYLDAQELPVPAPAPYEIGRYGIYEVPDAAALLRAWSSLHRPEGPVLKPWLQGDHALFWWSDPLPAITVVWRILRGRVGRALGRFPRLRAT